MWSHRSGDFSGGDWHPYAPAGTLLQRNVTLSDGRVYRSSEPTESPGFWFKVKAGDPPPAGWFPGHMEGDVDFWNDNEPDPSHPGVPGPGDDD